MTYQSSLIQLVTTNGTEAHPQCNRLGGIAATIQASFGNIAAGGLFATLQSAAMGGYGAATVAGAAQAAGAGASALAGVGMIRKSKDDRQEEDEAASEDSDSPIDGGDAKV